ncbi:MAG: hypothetical protein ACRDS9_27120 [Pseudonocardiaceae bacterium]
MTSRWRGREVLALAKAGCEVVGFESHKELARFGSRLLAAEGNWSISSPRAEVTEELADAGSDLVDFGSVDYGGAVGVKASTPIGRHTGSAARGEPDREDTAPGAVR